MAKELEIKFVHSATSEEQSERIMLEIFSILLEPDDSMVEPGQSKLGNGVN